MTTATIDDEAIVTTTHPALERVRRHFATIRAKEHPEPRRHGMRESATTTAASKLQMLAESAARAGIDLTMLDALLGQSLARVVGEHGGEGAVGLALCESYSFMGLRQPPPIMLNTDLGEAVRRASEAEEALNRLSEALPEVVRGRGVLPPGKLAAWLDVRRREAVNRVNELLAGGYADVAVDEIRAAGSPGLGLTRRLEIWRIVAEAAVQVPPAWDETFLRDWCEAPVVALEQFGVAQVEHYVPSIFA